MSRVRVPSPRSGTRLRTRLRRTSCFQHGVRRISTSYVGSSNAVFAAAHTSAWRRTGRMENASSTTAAMARILLRCSAPKANAARRRFAVTSWSSRLGSTLRLFFATPTQSCRNFSPAWGRKPKDRIRSEYNSPRWRTWSRCRPTTAPLRLRNQTQLGFKQVKWIKGLEFVADFADIGGGYHQDHEFFRYRQSHLTMPE